MGVFTEPPVAVQRGCRTSGPGTVLWVHGARDATGYDGTTARGTVGVTCLCKSASKLLWNDGGIILQTDLIHILLLVNKQCLNENKSQLRNTT